MLSETTRLCKRLVGWVKNNNGLARRGGGELYLAAVIVLVAVISFGLGRLSKIREEKTPITIENVKENTETGESKSLSTSNVDKNIDKTNGAGIMLEHNSSTISNFPSSSKIFVASRNGKKYYYAWCESANVIKEQNRVWFSTQAEAEKAGYQPAANCKGLK